MAERKGRYQRLSPADKVAHLKASARRYAQSPKGKLRRKLFYAGIKGAALERAMATAFPARADTVEATGDGA